LVVKPFAVFRFSRLFFLERLLCFPALLSFSPWCFLPQSFPVIPFHVPFLPPHGTFLFCLSIFPSLGPKFPRSSVFHRFCTRTEVYFFRLRPSPPAYFATLEPFAPGRSRFVALREPLDGPLFFAGFRFLVDLSVDHRRRPSGEDCLNVLPCVGLVLRDPMPLSARMDVWRTGSPVTLVFSFSRPLGNP